MSTNADNFLLIPGTNTTLELSTGGAASDIRSWIRDQVGVQGAELFINSIAQGGDSNTLINLHQGSVGIGVSPVSDFKLHVVGNVGVQGGVVVGGDLFVTGIKHFVQLHPEDQSLEIVYSTLEGGEAATYSRGSATLRGGKAIVSLPEHFGFTTEPDNLTAQLTPRGEWLQLSISSLTNSHLEVHEAQSKNGEFDYFVQGVRKGTGNYQAIRKAQTVQLRRTP
jgi:hypothetical protein